jgi:hypothetical protein
MNDLENVSSELLSLENVVDGATRNALALRLSEAKVAGVDKVLVRLIQRPELANNRGTLVHALRHYDCGPHVALLVDLVITGGFEVAHEALEAIETIEHVEGNEVRAAFEKVERVLGADGLQDWRRLLLDDLFDKFDRSD